MALLSDPDLPAVRSPDGSPASCPTGPRGYRLFKLKEDECVRPAFRPGA